MSEPFNLIKMLSGPFTGVYWAKVIMYLFGSLFMVFVAVGVYRGYFRNIPTTEQTAESIENHYNQPRATFGCATVKDYLKPPVNAVIK